MTSGCAQQVLSVRKAANSSRWTISTVVRVHENSEFVHGNKEESRVAMAFKRHGNTLPTRTPSSLLPPPQEISLSKVPASGDFRLDSRTESARNHMPQHRLPPAPRSPVLLSFPPTTNGRLMSRRGADAPPLRLPPLPSSVHGYPKCSPES